MGHRLLALSDDQFRSFVDNAVRLPTDDTDPEYSRVREARKELLDPEIIDRTFLTLVTIKKDVEGQLAAKRADFVRSQARTKNADLLRKQEETYRGWRAGALRFKNGVEKFLIEVRASRPQGPPDFVKQERIEALVAYEVLRRAVIAHRDHVCDDRCEKGCIADENLWRLVTA